MAQEQYALRLKHLDTGSEMTAMYKSKKAMNKAISTFRNEEKFMPMAIYIIDELIKPTNKEIERIKELKALGEWKEYVIQQTTQK